MSTLDRNRWTHLTRTAPRAMRRRTAAMLVLAAILLVVLLSMVAFAVDLGYIATVRTELQAAADAAVMAAVADVGISEGVARQKAIEYAGRNNAGAKPVRLGGNDVEFGFWDSVNRRFTANGSPRNAVRAVARKPDVTLFFGALLGKNTQSVQADAVAAINTRDIAFVIDLSGSMNNDTEIWATAAINGAFLGYPTIGSDLMAAVFQDFSYGSYPGVLQHVGNGNVAQDDLAYANLTKTGGYLSGAAIPATYRVRSGDSESTRKTKAYKWMIDKQLAVAMPTAKPTPNSATSYSYWARYLDYTIKPRSVSGRGTLPPNQDSYRLSGAGNPYTAAWPSLNSSSYTGFLNKLGYLTYVQFMMDFGWETSVTGSTKVPLSRLSPDCPWRVDTDPLSPGNGISFPPREQPTHAVRLAVMAAINKIAQVNQGIPDSIKDHVAVITFDTASGTTVKYALSATGCDYTQAKAACRDMQAVSDSAASTASENGLILAKNHIDPTKNPNARQGSTKLIVFLTDGLPNIKQSSNATISTYISQHPDGEWFSSGSSVYERNAVLMQANMMRGIGWGVHGVGVGLGADRTLMDRMARMAGTAVKDPDNPNGPKISPYATGNPADYQERLTAIFNDIVGSHATRLVQ